MARTIQRQRRTTIDLVEFAQLDGNGEVPESQAPEDAHFDYEMIASETGTLWDATAYLAGQEQEMGYVNFDHAVSEAKREGGYVWKV